MRQTAALCGLQIGYWRRMVVMRSRTIMPHENPSSCHGRSKSKGVGWRWGEERRFNTKRQQLVVYCETRRKEGNEWIWTNDWWTRDLVWTACEYKPEQDSSIKCTLCQSCCKQLSPVWVCIGSDVCIMWVLENVLRTLKSIVVYEVERTEHCV